MLQVIVDALNFLFFNPITNLIGFIAGALYFLGKRNGRL